MDASHGKVENMSEADVMNFTSLSQDLTHSDSPFYMETGSTTSDLPQNEIKNVKRENEPKFTLSEEMCSTLDDLLGDVNSGNYSQDVLTRPIDTSVSAFRQFKPIFKYHQTKAYNDEITFQNLTGGLPYIEKPELQSHVYNYAKDNNIMEDSFKEENPVGTNTSTNEDQIAHECLRQPPRSPPVIHCKNETLKFTEMSLTENTANESTLNSSQSESFLCKEYVHNDVEKPFYKENSFNLYDLRANYKTKAVAVSSKGIQNSWEIPEMSVSHQNEVEDVESPGIVSACSPAGISWSGEASWEDKTCDTEQDWESLQPLEEDMALNEVVQKLKRTNKEQRTVIQNLECDKMSLEKKLEELQVPTNKQLVFADIINKLKENMEALIEDKYRVMIEKNETDKTLQDFHDILTNTQKHLQESRKEKETLQVELKRIKGNYVCLQERYITEMQKKRQNC